MGRMKGRLKGTKGGMGGEGRGVAKFSVQGPGRERRERGEGGGGGGINLPHVV